MKALGAFTALALAVQAAALSIGGRSIKVERDTGLLQNIVTYDEHSLFVYGERLQIFSGEFHPFRLPVPDLWLDVFQKIKALGFNCVSFYVHWALLEGNPGEYRADGIFDFAPFFDAAKQAGIYLIARPGPYINAEASGGGFPGWLQRIKGVLRSGDSDYLKATDNYMAHIGSAIAQAQITNGGPVILAQPENEYSGGSSHFPDPAYMAYVKKQLTDAGVVVPLISNDAYPQGLFAPGDVVGGSTAGDVDIYGHDGYPLGFDCANPTRWPSGSLPTYYHSTHLQQSPTTPYSVVEFQGGAFDPWGGLGFDKCAILLNNEFARVFYKNMFASGTALLNLYMTYGGTNWGNLGHPGGYTSYDYGAAIGENREILREKYSEIKLQGNFIKVSPAYVTATVGNAVQGTYSSTQDIFTTPLWGNGSATNFYIIRHSDFQQQTPTTYTLTLKTSQGVQSIPQLGGQLTLSGRDSKFHVTDYDLGGTTLLYSTAEIVTWKKFDKKTFVVVYGGANEQHELAVISTSAAKVIEGQDVTTKSLTGSVAVNWKTSTARRVVQVDNLFIYIVDKNTAYNYWVPDFARDDKWGSFDAGVDKRTSVIVEAGYFVRSVYVNGPALHIDGNVNATTPIRVIGAPSTVRSLHFNSAKLDFTTDPVTGEWSSTLNYAAPQVSLPDLSALSWKYVDDLPEIGSSYDDSAWTKADLTTSNNLNKFGSPTCLYGSEYGYHTGVLIFRGSFLATGKESTLKLWTQGGSAFGSSVWIGSTYVGSWTGIDAADQNNSTYTLPNLTAGQKYTITVVIDNNGLDENWIVGDEKMKAPRGIRDFDLAGHAKTDVSWKLTGNLGGEKYIDKERGPLNEGGLFAERQGFHQPYPPNRLWPSASPLKGIDKPGIAFYQASFKLDLPKNYDIPLTFDFGNTTIGSGVANYRAQLWVNGYQFGKYINNVGPQRSFPVPQGILNYHGTNWLAVELWAQQANGAHLSDFTLSAGTPAWTDMKEPNMAPTPDYRQRPGAY